jgi:CubicO group peptidase (beta-lactamase class C family)
MEPYMTTAIRRTFLITLSATAVSCSQEAPRPPDPIDTLKQPERLAALDSLIPALMDSAQVTGLSMAIVNDSGIVWSRAYGVRSLETGEPVNVNSVFEAASLSKPVFAYAVLQLAEEGVIDLDTPLAEYYEYEDIAHDERHRLITPRIVLTHSPGFPNWRPWGGQLTIDFEPGSEFSYSGEGFGYLQRAVMAITGEPLQQLMKRLVFEPLGMTSSGYIWDDRFDENLAMPHSGNGEVMRKNKPTRGRGHAAATLHTTAPDFARFMVAMMNGTGLSDSMATAMLSPQIEVDSGVTWGLGIGLQENESGRAFWHWGDNSGYKAYTVAYPERDVGLIWFTNSENGHAFLESMLDETVGGDHPAAGWLAYDQFNDLNVRLREALWKTIEEEGVVAAFAQYHEAKDSYPPEAFDEYVLNTLGYRLLRREDYREAIAIFKANVDEYPDAWNPYDSLGQAYMEAGDLELALEYYEKSVEMNPENEGGKAALERIRAELAETG